MTRTHQITVGFDNNKSKLGRAAHYISLRANGIKKAGDGSGQDRFFFATKAEAKQFAMDLNAAQNTGGVIMRHAAKSVGAAIEAYKTKADSREAAGAITDAHRQNLRSNADCWKSKICDGVTFEDMMCADVSTAMIERMFDQFDCSVKTLKEKLNPLKQAFDLAHREGWIGHVNPARQVKLEVVKYKGEAAAEDADLEKIDLEHIRQLITKAADIDGSDGIAVAFACQTGLRFGEQAALKWKHIDFDRKVVNVRLAMRKQRGGSVAADIPKNTKQNRVSKARRVVPLTADLLTRLREWRMRSEHSGDNDYVFPTRLGTPQVTADNWRKRILHPLCFKVDGLAQLRWHDLRHVFASVCLATLGEDLVRISDLMGHESVETTRSIYGHWIDNPERDQSDADAFNNALWGAK